MRIYLKALVILMVLSIVAAGTYAQKPKKYGHIDSNELLKIMPGRDSAVAKVTEYAKTLEKQVQGMQAELQSKIDDYQAHVNDYTPLIKSTKEKEIQDIQARLEAFQTSAQDDLEKQQTKYLQPIIDKAKAAIEKVAKENGYTYIFDAGLGVLLYSDPSEDIMPLVKTELGLK
jgi:outer membrane protein